MGAKYKYNNLHFTDKNKRSGRQCQCGEVQLAYTCTQVSIGEG